MLDIDQYNARLTYVKLRLKNNSNRVYLRATLPNPNDTEKKQRDISTGLANNPQGLKLAYAKALELEADLIYERFSWDKWGKTPISKKRHTEILLKEFEEHYWSMRKKTKGRLETYSIDYQRYFNYLPERTEITGEILKKCLLEFEVGSRSRIGAYTAYNALAVWAKIELPEHWKKLRTRYQASNNRVIPNENEIIDIREKIKNKGWQWVFGMLTVYGLRPHELFFVKLDLFPIIEVLEGKTGYRKVYPVPSHLADEWKLNEVIWPKLHLGQDSSHRYLGKKISNGFRQNKLGIVPYALRDAFAIRCAVLGIDSSIAARLMGHSIIVHTKHYQRWIDDISMSKIMANF